MFDKIYELADKIEMGDPGELDERARTCRSTAEQVNDVNMRLYSVRTELSDAWQSGAGQKALADLDAFRDNRYQQAEDLEKSARSFEVVRDALERAKREAADKRAEAKDLEAKLNKAWRDAEKNPFTIPGAWAENTKAKIQAALLLADMERMVLAYDKVLNDEGATIRGLKGQIDEDAATDLRAARDREAGVIGYLSHIIDVASRDPNLAKSLLIDKAMENPAIAKAIYETLGFKYVEDGDFYTTGEHSIQRYLGWHDLYDKLGPLIGADLDETGEPNIGYTDPDTGKQYRLELWKGSYGFDGSYGGEVGFYTRDGDSKGPPGWFGTAQGDDQIKVTQQIYDKHDPSHVYFTNDGQGADDPGKQHYWNLGIRSDPNVNADDLGQRATLEVKDPQVRDGLYESMQNYAKTHPEFKPQKNPDGTLSYTWE